MRVIHILFRVGPEFLWAWAAAKEVPVSLIVCIEIRFGRCFHFYFIFDGYSTSGEIWIDNGRNGEAAYRYAK